VKLILSSTSPARRALLARLRYPFASHAPNVDETALKGESVKDTVSRLALDKATAACSEHPNALIIGCDQLISVKDRVLGKPHTLEKATEQLLLCSKQVLTSYTALCLLNSTTAQSQQTIVPYQVKFKALTPTLIHEYLQADEPFFCAGSIKAESLGPTLFEWMRGDDPNALTGLPLISLNNMLLNEGVNVLSPEASSHP